jgi:hypothetical protein
VPGAVFGDAFSGETRGGHGSSLARDDYPFAFNFADKGFFIRAIMIIDSKIRYGIFN